LNPCACTGGLKPLIDFTAWGIYPRVLPRSVRGTAAGQPCARNPRWRRSPPSI